MDAEIPLHRASYQVRDSTASIRAPNTAAFAIIPSRLEFASQVASLHCNFIAGSNDVVGSEWGLEYLEAYYRERMYRLDAVLLMAVADERVVGFACLLQSYQKAMLGLGLRHPYLLFRLAKYAFLSGCALRYIRFKIAHELLGGKWPEDSQAYKNAAELRAVVVEPEFRNQRIGKALLIETLKRAEEMHLSTIIAWVRDDNPPSKRIFEGCGFVKVSSRQTGEGDVNLYAWRSTCGVQSASSDIHVAGSH
jgi:ribosomal protein S18 acetylase RimI-like enzyme